MYWAVLVGVVGCDGGGSRSDSVHTTALLRFSSPEPCLVLGLPSPHPPLPRYAAPAHVISSCAL